MWKWKKILHFSRDLQPWCFEVDFNFVLNQQPSDNRLEADPTRNLKTIRRNVKNCRYFLANLTSSSDPFDVNINTYNAI